MTERTNRLALLRRGLMAAAAFALLAYVAGHTAEHLDAHLMAPAYAESGSGDGGGDGDNGGDDGDSGEGDDSDDSDDSGDDVEVGDDLNGIAPGTGLAAGAAIERDGSGERVAGEVVAVGNGDTISARATGLGFTVKSRTVLDNLGVTAVRLAVPRGTTIAEAQPILAAAMPGFEIVANDVYRVQATEVALKLDNPARLMGWTVASPGCGAGVGVGLIDSGVDVSRLAGAKMVERSFFPADEPVASTAHGTAVASVLIGTADATTQGLVPGIELYSANVFSLDENGAPITTAVRLAEAIDWLMGMRVRIANLSLAGRDNAVLRMAVAGASKGGMVIVAAAGNGGPEAPPAYPAGYDPVLAITAIDARMLPLPAANRGSYVDYAAPGSVAVGAAPGSTRSEGTSFAAPYVTALLAGALGSGGSTTAAMAIAALTETAIDLGPLGRDDIFGWGLVHSQGVCGMTASDGD